MVAAARNFGLTSSHYNGNEIVSPATENPEIAVRILFETRLTPA
jgi:hypothetical protein